MTPDPTESHATPLTDPAAPSAARHDVILHRTEQIIARLLRWGVLISLGLLIFGTLVSFIVSQRYGHTSDDLPRLIGKAGDFPHTLTWLREGLLALRGQALIVLGLLILIATPLLRVAVSIIAYAIERDVAFVLITSLVLALLVLSIVLGGHG